ncbi:hypothetical protein Pla22_31480 [Rubripirellula amarantea]|uniref:Uncharacterized protein n=1 Tax=Rubripirellula amarantea TaxID=2527999 RepID=A0A5C5WJW7_9BACT|nr:hypothetical protein Pla22_31480 [Rubripirellula amarantea]
MSSGKTPPYIGHDACHAELPAAKLTARCHRSIWAGCPHALRRERSDRLSLAAVDRCCRTTARRRGEPIRDSPKARRALTIAVEWASDSGMDAAVAQGMEADQRVSLKGEF